MLARNRLLLGSPLVKEINKPRMVKAAFLSLMDSQRKRKWSMMNDFLSSKTGSVTGRPFCWFRVCRKIQGFLTAPLPIMIPSQPVSAFIRSAAVASLTSPLPITGILTVALTFLIHDQSAGVEKLWVANLGWTVIASAPQSSAIWATSQATGSRGDHPARIFIVRGRGQDLRTA